MVNIYDKRRILIFGFGREGKAAYEYLATEVPEAVFSIYDDGPLNEATRKLPATVLDNSRPVSEHAERYHFDLVVKSPGVSLYRGDIRQLEAAGIEVTSGTDIWLSIHGSRNTIAVTGTKGKSTTSSLIAFVLRQSGYDVQLLGNLGVPLINQPAGRDFTVLELSSYQTAGLKSPVDVAVFTNLYEEHIPWHGSVERYQADKLRLANISSETQVIYNAGDLLLSQRFRDDNRSRGGGFGVSKSDAGQITWRGNGVGAHFRLQGEHNLVNLALALDACEVATKRPIAGCHLDFSSFESLPHRLEEHILANGALAVDDSIATVPEATLNALEVYRDKTIHLFLGGFDRGVSLKKLIDALPALQLGSLVLSGPVGSRLYDELPEAVKKSAVIASDLVSGVEGIFGKVKRGEVLLLSPSATSFDEFRDYADRGKAFVAACQRLASHSSTAARESHS